jgi:hypothetical protein
MAKQPERPAWQDMDGLGIAGHGLAAALGILALIAAVFSFRAGIQITLTVALVIVGVLLPALAWLSANRSRGAWSFLISLSAVLGIMTLFGSPKVRALVGIHIGIALAIPLAFVFMLFALWAQDHRYKT